jgi:hypothetical protein
MVLFVKGFLGEFTLQFFAFSLHRMAIFREKALKGPFYVTGT